MAYLKLEHFPKRNRPRAEAGASMVEVVLLLVLVLLVAFPATRILGVRTGNTMCKTKASLERYPDNSSFTQAVSSTSYCCISGEWTCISEASGSCTPEQRVSCGTEAGNSPP
jgi:hypothetical protein